MPQTPTVHAATVAIAPPEATSRDALLASLQGERWDLLVVGGGIVGCGVLLDAVSRGLRAALVEQDDIAVGTSSRSSRLIHGGLRYLEGFHFRLVREALDERSRLLRLAPHLVRLAPFLFPVYGLPLVHRAFYGSGLILYDLLGSARDGGRAHHLGAAATLRAAPGLRPAGLRGSVTYHDGVEDDARLALAVARTGIAAGGTLATRIRVTGTLTDAGGRAIGVAVQDRVTDATGEIRATRIVDATGVWSGRPGAPLGGSSVPIVPSRGTHLVVSRDRLPITTGITLRVPGKVVFVVPWPDAWLIGTTDERDSGDPDRPTPTGHEVSALLDTVNRTLDVDLRREDLLGTFTGLRPLVGDPGGGSTVKVSREHRVGVERTGVVRVSGGKYTTYRLMARDAVDAALGSEAAARPSRTAEMALVGAADTAALTRLAGDLAAQHGLDRALVDALVARHGTEASAVLALGAQQDLLRPLASGVRQLEAEVVWAARNELALSLDDLLSRRMRLSTMLRDRGEAIAPRVAALLGGELGWDAARQASEIGSYLVGAHREFDVPPVEGEAGPA